MPDIWFNLIVFRFLLATTENPEFTRELQDIKVSADRRIGL